MVQHWQQLKRLQVLRLELRYESSEENQPDDPVLQSLRAIKVEEFATEVLVMLPSLRYCHLHLDKHLPMDTAWRVETVKARSKSHASGAASLRVLERLPVDDERSRRLFERPIEESFEDV